MENDGVSCVAQLARFRLIFYSHSRHGDYTKQAFFKTFVVSKKHPRETRNLTRNLSVIGSIYDTVNDKLRSKFL